MGEKVERDFRLLFVLLSVTHCAWLLFAPAFLAFGPSSSLLKKEHCGRCFLSAWRLRQGLPEEAAILLLNISFDRVLVVV